MKGAKHGFTIICRFLDNMNFHKNLVKEVLASASLKSQSIEQKAKLQNQILLNKRYLSRFKW